MLEYCILETSRTSSSP